MKSIITLLVLAALAPSAFSYSSGPPDNRCGNPPNNAYCTQCHSSFPLNSGDGSVVLAGLPVDGFVPNQTYPLTVTITDPGQQRWGFEITAEYQSGSNWLQAGTFTITQSTFTQLSAGAGTAPDFVKQTSAGTYPGTSGPQSWQFNWTAPDATVQTVGFYLAGNAANGGQSSGDYIYGVSYMLDQYTPPPPEPPVVSDIPDHTIAIFNMFDDLDLNQYVDDPDTPDSLITWECEGATMFVVDIVDGIAYFEPLVLFPAPFGVDTLVFTASDPGGLSDSDFAVYTIINNPPVLGDIPDITVISNEPIPDTDLFPFVSDPEPQTLYLWSIHGDSTNIMPEFNDNVLSFTQVVPDWSGSQTFTVEVMDGGGLTDTDEITITLLANGIQQIHSTAIPKNYALNPAYPNPFNPETTISFALPHSGQVELTVFDSNGRQLRNLYSGELAAGYYNVRADMRTFASGIYLVSMKSGDFSAVQKIVLVK